MDQPRFHVERNSEGGPGAIPKMWEAADAFFDRYSDTSIDPLEREAVKNQLTGMTVVIHLVMRPYYASRDDVVREIMARADARSRGEAPLTRGMGWISVCPEDGGSPFEAAVGGRGYTSDPKGMADPPFGYPQERVNEHRARLAMRPDDKASAPRVKADHTPPVGLVEKVEEIKQRSVAGFDNKLLAQAYSVTLSDIAWALKQ